MLLAPVITNAESQAPRFIVFAGDHSSRGFGYGVVRLVLSNALMMKLSPKFMDLHSKMKSRTDFLLKR